MSLHNQLKSNMKNILSHIETSEYKSNYNYETPPQNKKCLPPVPSYNEEPEQEAEKMKKAFKFLFYIHH